eukprot:3655882-Amphidinium_carterae.1
MIVVSWPAAIEVLARHLTAALRDCHQKLQYVQGAHMPHQPLKEEEEEVAEMTHLSKADPEIHGSMAKIPGGDFETIQITPGSAQVVLEEPVEDHPVGVG